MPTPTATTTRPQPQHRAFKMRLDPNAEQAQQLAQAAGAARVAYNMLIAHNRDAFEAGQARKAQMIKAGVSAEDAAQQLKRLRADEPSLRVLGYMAFASAHLTPEIQRHRAAAAALAGGAEAAAVWPETERYAQPWLHTVPRRVLVSGLQNAGRAFDNWFGSMTGARAGARVGRPRFKKKGASRDSFTIPAPEVIGAKGTAYKRGEARRGTIQDYRHLRLGFLGVLRTHESTKRLVRACRAGAVIRSFTVSRAADRWYASVLVEMPQTEPPAPTRRQREHGAVGVDVGVKSLAALSTGEIVTNPRHGAKGAGRLAGLQRKLARTQKGSQRRQRLLRQIARQHHLVSLRRAGQMHELTKRLATTFEVVAIEDLNVSGMTRSARGTRENPGTNVAAKSGLNRSILDASLAQLRQQLGYKTRWYGAQLRTIDRYAPSSKRCSNCGAVKTKLSLSERVFDCEHCGLVLDRDVNAAINIRTLATGPDGPADLGQLAPGMGESLNGRGEPSLPSPTGEGSPGRAHGSVKTAAETLRPPQASDRLLIHHTRKRRE